MMRRQVMLVGFLLAFIASAISQDVNASSAPHPQKKEWTFLVFLNGFNNLDRFGLADLNEMEKVGSTDKINVVVQWASMRERKVRRLYVQKDNDTKKITSPVIEDLGSADMGSYKELQNFVKWGAEHYPAEHYFVDVWNHGNGWQVDADGDVSAGGVSGVKNISYDDVHGTEITTEELGLAMQDFANVLGQKVDIVGADACLMAMVEVAAELAPSTNFLVGSQDLEPGDGWPYDQLLTDWNNKPKASAKDVGKILTKRYVKSYWNQDEISFASYDLSKYDEFARETRDVLHRLQQCTDQDWQKAFNEVKTYPSYTHSSYVDLEYAFKGMQKMMCSNYGLGITQAWSGLRTALNMMVSYKEVSPAHKGNPATIGYWFPKSKTEYNQYKDRYSKMQFNRDTGWMISIEKMIPFMSEFDWGR